MSISKQLLQNKRSKRNGRSFRPATLVTVTADWARVDAEQLRTTISVVAATGGALRLGCSRDGGAFAVGIYGDGEQPYTLFVRPEENMEEFLQELEQTFWQLGNNNEVSELP